jgi:beta-glucanase (GH16 family)
VGTEASYDSAWNAPLYRLGVVLVVAVMFVMGTFASPAMVPSASAAAPNCGGMEIPKQAPTSTLVAKKKLKKKHGKQNRKRASKKRRAAKKKKRVTKSAGDYWRCTFSDDFDGPSLDMTKWIPQRTDDSGYTSGPTACFVDSPNNISVSNGTLQLTARKEASPFTCKDPYGDFTTQYTSGMVSTYGGRFSQAYGRFEIRAKISSARVSGLQTSFWLWPRDPKKYGDWPTSGEIDIAELYSQYADRAIPYVHYTADIPDHNVTSNSCVIGNPDDFHTYAVEWTTSQLKVIYDGKTCLIDTLAKPQPFDQPFIIALTQALGMGTNQFDPTSTPLPATTVVDYVRVWS